MNKIFNVAYKDLLLTFRDAAALIMMFATPFGLTLVFGFAFGGFGGQSSATLEEIPVLIVNMDAGQLGENLVEVFQSDDLADLIEPVLMQDTVKARSRVDQNEAAAAILIPAGFSARLIPSGEFAGEEEAQPPVLIEVYANPGRPVSAGVVRSIVDIYLGRVNAAYVAGRLSAESLLQSGALDNEIARQVSEQAVRQAVLEGPLRLEVSMAGESGAAEESFDWLAFTAPSMAILFLMFTVASGGRSILAERQQGTMPRMLISPSTPAQILGGKVLGIFLTGLAQVSILIFASRILLGVVWGSFLATALIVVTLVFAATGWGVVLAAYGRSPGQVSALGTAIALIFGAAGGNFVPRPAMPEWLQIASYISPNAWGLEAFMDLAAGAGLPDVLLPALALLLMGAVLFLISLVAFRRQYQR